MIHIVSFIINHMYYNTFLTSHIILRNVLLKKNIIWVYLLGYLISIGAGEKYDIIPGFNYISMYSKKNEFSVESSTYYFSIIFFFVLCIFIQDLVMTLVLGVSLDSI